MSSSHRYTREIYFCEILAWTYDPEPYGPGPLKLKEFLKSNMLLEQCAFQIWGSNWGYSGFLPSTHAETQTKCVHDLHTLCGVSRVFIITLRLQYIRTWRITVILIPGKPKSLHSELHARIKMPQVLDLPCISVVVAVSTTCSYVTCMWLSHIYHLHISYSTGCHMYIMWLGTVHKHLFGGSLIQKRGPLKVLTLVGGLEKSLQIFQGKIEFTWFSMGLIRNFRGKMGILKIFEVWKGGPKMFPMIFHLHQVPPPQVFVNSPLSHIILYRYHIYTAWVSHVYHVGIIIIHIYITHLSILCVFKCWHHISNLGLC